MGKAVKKITKSISKIVKKPVQATAGLVGLKSGTQSVTEAADTTSAAPEAPVAEQEATDEGTGDTESNRRRARSGGKKSLSVSRSAGQGVNL